MGCNASAAKGTKIKIQLYGVTGSMNCMGAILLLADNNMLEMKQTMPGQETQTPEFLKINPYGAVPALKDGEYNLAESTAILRYIANKYVTAAYPPDEKTRAHIDWACDRFGTSMYSDAAATIYPVMGYAPAPQDKDAAAKKCMENLESFCAKFLTTKFVGGDEPSIADYKVAPFFFLYEHPALKEKSGVTCPDRIKSFNKDFQSKSKNYKMLIEAGGFSVKEIIEKASEVKGEVPSGTGFTPPEGAVTLPKDIATTGKIEVYGVPVSMNAMGAILFVNHVNIGEMKQCMPGQDTTTEAFLKMNPFHGIPVVKDGDYAVAESAVCLRYLAEKYYPACYPPQDPQKRGTIDWALDRFASVIYPYVVKLLYPIMGFGEEVAEKEKVAEECMKHLKGFTDLFLRDKFVAGTQLTIADFKIAPFFYLFSHEGVEKLSGVTANMRVKGFYTDFEQSVKATSMLKSAGGFSLKEFVEQKIREKGK